MVTGVVVVEGPGRRLAYRRPSAWLRMRARAAGDRLDRQLAAGVAPEESPMLAVHAQQIVSPQSCASLAGSLRRIMAAAEVPVQTRQTRIGVNRAGVQAASDLVSVLVERLDLPAPVRAQGIAEIRCLLGDGTSPAYRPSPLPSDGRNDASSQFRMRIAAAIDHL
jgi:hypothetical protein